MSDPLLSFKKESCRCFKSGVGCNSTDCWSGVSLAAECVVMFLASTGTLASIPRFVEITRPWAKVPTTLPCVPKPWLRCAMPVRRSKHNSLFSILFKNISSTSCLNKYPKSSHKRLSQSFNRRKTWWRFIVISDIPSVR